VILVRNGERSRRLYGRAGAVVRLVSFLRGEWRGVGGVYRVRILLYLCGSRRDATGGSFAVMIQLRVDQDLAGYDPPSRAQKILVVG